MRLKFYKNLLVILLILTIASIATIVWHKSKNLSTNTPIEQLPNPEEIVHVTDLKTSRFVGDKRVASISCQSLSALPRKFGIFKLNSTYEMVMKDVEVNFYLQNKRPDQDFKPFALTSSLDGTIEGLDKMGNLLKRTIESIILKIHYSEQLSLVMTADKAIIDPRTGKTRLENIKIEHIPSTRKVIAQSAIWNHSTLSFEIPGNYLLESDKSTKIGRGVDVRLDFKLTKHMP